MRQLASIQRIIDIKSIEGADSIDVAQILGWYCVVKKGEFQVNELVVFCEVDSILPERPEFEFMRARSFRVKTIKLRGQISQGLCLSLSILNDIQVPIEEGLDVTEVLGITKYEPYVKGESANLGGNIKGNFPSFIPKTDETRIQSVPQVLERHNDKYFMISEKLDGSSVTIYLNNGVFGVCSRNLDLKESDSNAFWQVVRRLDMENKLKALGEALGLQNVAIQGELIGPGVQGNKYKRKELEVYAFNIFNIDNSKYIDSIDFLNICAKVGIVTVPIIYEPFWMLNKTVDDLVKMSMGSSKLYDTPREGLVFRGLREENDIKLGRLSFKVINPTFLLKNNE